ncbi:MAG: glycosyltransferase, partial [Bacteroidetes bacterium]|nr:glycosyltransferase [Fibrella sp.]
MSPRSLLGSFNWLPDSALYDRLNRHNGQKLAGEIKTALKQLDWESYIVINDNDMIRGFYTQEFLKPELLVYYLRDNLLATSYWQRHGGRLEPQLMSRVDLIASNSVYLTAQAARYNAHSIYIGQGCDLALFDPTKEVDEPAEMASLRRPRIGYTGALTSLRLDADLIETVARRQPDWQIILMGGVDESFPKERLRALSNVIFLDAKPMHTVPAYLASMDVLINPQVLNEVTIGNYPRKIDEYLAMGKPVVAVKTDAMVLFGEHVYLAETADEFIEGIANALAGNQHSSAEERTAFALEHSWDNSV